jgi:hypothetical protein
MTLLVLESVAAIDTATRKTEKCVTAGSGGVISIYSLRA